MSYYGTGDYYMAGDPGLLSSIGGFLRKIGGRAVGQVPIVGPAITIGREVFRRGQQARGPQIVLPGGGQVGRGIPSMGGVRRKRRRMNYGNAKALKRSFRRQEGFVKLAKEALKGSNYKIVTKSAGSRRRQRLTVKESGPGSVIVT